MSRKKYFSYIRVSTQRQGQHGTSLAEQQAAIERFAINWNLLIVKRFEERETAAKQGRPVFLDMLKQLKSRKADGVVIHKIDRSARNLKDWADLGSLIDNGLEVHFASESLDLNSRGGRLSADIQAVVASDYIRNLREETKKGLYGRLKQGLYPFRAPIGYLDSGKGKQKRIDPVAGPKVKRAFEIYSSGRWSLIPLVEEMNRIGLRGKNGKRLTLNGLATILHNPFYKGLIRIKKTNETFIGFHEPIISRDLYQQVQDVFAGKNARKKHRHFVVFRKLISCGRCARYLTPEIQKGIIYYRCRTRFCLGGCLREEEVTQRMVELTRKLKFTDEEHHEMRNAAASQLKESRSESQTELNRIKMEMQKIDDRFSRLADAFMEGVFDKEIYIKKKNELIELDHHYRQRAGEGIRELQSVSDDFDLFCELANSAYLSYKSGNDVQKRNLVQTLCANLSWDGKILSIKPKDPFRMVADRSALPFGSPSRDQRRTITQLAKRLVKFFIDNPGTLRPEFAESQI